MFGIGMPEMILILAVALIVIGPKKLPDLAKSLGKAMGEFKKATSDLKESMQIDTELKDVKRTFEGIEKDIRKKSEDHADPANISPDDAAEADASSPADQAQETDQGTTEPPKAPAEQRTTKRTLSDTDPSFEEDAHAFGPVTDSKGSKG